MDKATGLSRPFRWNLTVAAALLAAGPAAVPPASAASGAPKIIGFCSYLHENVINYKSSVFQTNRADREDWEWDWRNYLIKSEINFFGGAQCFGWKNSTVEFVESERAKSTPYIRNVFLDYVPDDTTRYGEAEETSPQRTRSATADKPTPDSQKSAPGPQSKYVEVAGPNGTIRLSPEVLARNQAAAEEYRRKMEEHARAKADHERKLALHQQNQAAAAAEQSEYQRQLAMNEAEVAAHNAAMARHNAATKPEAAGSKGWMYCDARGEIGSKRRFYSRIAEVAYVPGQVSIIDVMAKNRAAFKAYLSATHKVFFATDSLLHCPYSTDDLAEAEGLQARDTRGDANNGIEIVQTGWSPTN